MAAFRHVFIALVQEVGLFRCYNMIFFSQTQAAPVRAAPACLCGLEDFPLNSVFDVGIFQCPDSF